MKHIKIILVPDKRYPGPAGCAACYYRRGAPGQGCTQPLKFFLQSTCLSAVNGGVFKDGGHFTVKASVSRNKREGKMVHDSVLRWIGRNGKLRTGGFLPPELGGRHG